MVPPLYLSPNIMIHDNFCIFRYSMDWFKGKSTGKPHDLHGKIYGFLLKFSQQNQSNQIYSTSLRVFSNGFHSSLRPLRPPNRPRTAEPQIRLAVPLRDDVYPCGHLAPPGRCWWGFNQGPQAFPTRNGYEKL